MTKEAGTSASGGKEIMSQNRARFLTQGELVTRAGRDLSGLIGKRKLQTVDRFIEKKVTGIHLNGVDVISIDVDHTTKIDSYITAYMKSPRTKLIMPEFFYPEIASNAGILAGPMRKIKEGGSAMYGARLQAVERIEKALREADKPVMVADIADRGSYVASNYAFRLAPVFLGAAISLITKQDLAVVAGALAGTGHASNILRRAHFGTGIFDPDDISSFDRYVLDLEQARRLSLALGVRQVTSEYAPQDQGSETPQILMLYPRAHGKRVADILVNPHPGWDKYLSRVYRLFGPNLHHTVRTFELENLQEQLTTREVSSSSAREIFPSPDNGLAEWVKISDKKIKL